MVNDSVTIPVFEPPLGLRSFVAGTENRLANVVIRSALNSGHDTAARPYNPLVLCGPAGVGKSHLARGLASAWPTKTESTETKSNAELYLTAADFYRRAAVAQQTDSLASFRRWLRAASLLVLEDIEQLAGKLSAQNELIALIDESANRNMLLVITAKQPPQQIARNSKQRTTLLPALRSRLAAGLVVLVKPPGKASRLKIVRQLAADRGLSIPEAATELIAKRIEGTTRDLLGALLELQLECELSGKSPSLRATRDFLNEKATSACPTLAEILTATARCFSLPVATLKGPSRSQMVVTARSIAIYLSRELTHLSLQEIGRSLGGRDHTTVLHNERKIRRLVDSISESGYDAQIAQTVCELRASLM